MHKTTYHSHLMVFHTWKLCMVFPLSIWTPFAQRAMVNWLARNGHRLWATLENITCMGGRETAVALKSLCAVTSCGDMASKVGKQARSDLGKPHNMCITGCTTSNRYCRTSNVDIWSTDNRAHNSWSCAPSIERYACNALHFSSTASLTACINANNPDTQHAHAADKATLTSHHSHTSS